ncbi:tyrosine-type recombinase/integrase [Williamsia soli]|uniref:tyrosine-type recombinase/integrase n=1 Tax=Williamsia soli TaxID=364929 RepID=UPI001A9E8EE4|nr:tyrosine-type recombinase/integrase [Williamsia soli]
MTDVPAQFRSDIGVWVQALRGNGSRPSIPVQWVTVRTYVKFALPVLKKWARRYSSLREVTRKDVELALTRHRGNSPHNVHTALRSLFGRLKREKRVFTDPARGVVGHFARRLPRPLPTDRLRGLLTQLESPKHRLIVALVAVHAVGISEVQALQLSDVDLAHGTLTVKRKDLQHIIYLDEAVHRLVQEWIDYRYRYWPGTPNRYLFVSRYSADVHKPMSPYGLTTGFRIIGIGAGTLRADRIFDEAAHTSDPVRLMNVFGIGVTTAVRYVRAAHPTRFDLDPISE